MKNYYNKKYFRERDVLSPHIAQVIKIFIKNNNLKNVLDVGCGTGRLVKFLNQAGFAATGCDSQKKALKIAKKINNSKVIIEASATKLPFGNNSFDLVTAISVIEHLTRDEVSQFIAEAARVLKTGGFIFLITPNFASPIRVIQGKNWFGYRDPTHITFFTPGSLSRILKSHRFSKIKFNFKIAYQPSFDWEFPPIFSKFPKILKYFLIYLFFSTRLAFLRNGFWIGAQKHD